MTVYPQYWRKVLNQIQHWPQLQNQTTGPVAKIITYFRSYFCGMKLSISILQKDNCPKSLKMMLKFYTYAQVPTMQCVEYRKQNGIFTGNKPAFYSVKYSRNSSCTRWLNGEYTNVRGPLAIGQGWTITCLCI